MTIKSFISEHSTAVAYLGGLVTNWLVSFVKHVPAPHETSVWFGAAFDATQDVAKNTERINERRKVLTARAVEQVDAQIEHEFPNDPALKGQKGATQ